jgi:hypothetical protein
MPHANTFITSQFLFREQLAYRAEETQAGALPAGNQGSNPARAEIRIFHIEPCNPA